MSSNYAEYLFFFQGFSLMHTGPSPDSGCRNTIFSFTRTVLQPFDSTAGNSVHDLMRVLPSTPQSFVNI